MRIESLFGNIGQFSEIAKCEDVKISQSDMIENSTGWQTIIDKQRLYKVNLVTDSIQVQLFDSAGNEVGSGLDFAINVSSDSIIINCITPKENCNYLTLRILSITRN